MLYAELSSPEIASVAPECVTILPLAAVEQHGDHLPLITDTAITTEFGRRIELALSEKILLLPTLWAGSSDHHLGFSGTTSISSETYIRVLQDLLESLISAGCRRIFLLNGHGGNQIPFSEAIYRVAMKHRAHSSPPKIAAQSYWNLAEKELASQTFMATRRLTHACEYETSMMLFLRPDLVKMSEARGARPLRGSTFYDPLDYEPSRVFVVESFEAMTSTGALGNPEQSTAEKGRMLMDLITPVLVRFVNEFSAWK